MPAASPTAPASTRALPQRAAGWPAWTLTLAALALLAPGLRQTKRPVPPARFVIPADLQSTEPAFVWVDAPPIRIEASWADPALDEPATEPTDEPAPDLRLFSDHHYLEFFTPADPKRLNYKFDPAFGFSDRKFQVRGFMIRFRIDF
jgi:hypothetical protein